MIKKMTASLILLLFLSTAAMYKPNTPPDDVDRQYATGASQFIDLDGQRVHYRDEGQGHPIILVHGTSASLHTWDGWAYGLKNKYRVIRMDLPAFGLTGPSQDQDYTVASYVKFVKAVADYAGVTSFTLAGNSLGGHIAWRYALEHPADVQQLILLDASGYPRDDTPLLILLGKAPIMGDLMPWLTPKWVVKDQVERVYGDISRIKPGTIDRYYNLLLRDGNRKAFQQYTRSQHTSEKHKKLSTISAPTLIMWGDRDRLIPLDWAWRFGADIPNSTIKIYKGVGHVPMEEIPMVSSSDLDEFLVDQMQPVTYSTHSSAVTK